MNKAISNILNNHSIYNAVDLTHETAGRGVAYVLDRCYPRGNSNLTPNEIETLTNAGAIISRRSYRYAPELTETFIFVPNISR